VALFGGLGVYFMSSGGQGGGDPVLLRADADPVRVRPEDPGGAVVPNQDSQVYERVAGGGEDVRSRRQGPPVGMKEAEWIDAFVEGGPEDLLDNLIKSGYPWHLFGQR
jgi:hypothetical protein